MRILLAEDEHDLNNIITLKLKSEGYCVDSFYNGKDAIAALSVAEYDAAILDIMMPGANGYEVLEYMKTKKCNTPVIFLTARDSISDRVKGLDSGANDYLTKPFAFDELLARLRAMTRQTVGMPDNLLTVHDLTMDCAAHTVKRNGKNIYLSAKEYALLEYLMRNKGMVLSREKIEDHIWNFDYEGGTNVIDVYIRYLRKKLDDGFDTKLIHTVRGAGYVIKDEQ